MPTMSERIERPVQQCLNVLYRHILALGVPKSDAEDILQETCVILCQKLDSFTEGTNFLAWARAIATNNVLAWRRNNARHAKRLSLVALEVLSKTVELDPNNLFEDWRMEALRQCLARLPEAMRERLLTHAQHNRNKAAQMLSINPAALDKSISRWKLKVFACVEERLAVEKGNA